MGDLGKEKYDIVQIGRLHHPTVADVAVTDEKSETEIKLDQL